MTATENRIQISRTINAPAGVIFAVLAHPSRHPEFDGSGMVRSSEDDRVISGEGDVFVMHMHAEAMGGDYDTHNHVTAFAQNEAIAWRPATAAHPDEPAGWEWRYDLDATDERSTAVTLSYDWSGVDDPELAGRFPVVSPESLAGSLNALAAVAESEPRA